MTESETARRLTDAQKGMIVECRLRGMDTKQTIAAVVERWPLLAGVVRKSHVSGVYFRAKQGGQHPPAPITLCGPKWSLAGLPYKHFTQGQAHG